jgi:hypothetical protein
LTQVYSQMSANQEFLDSYKILKNTLKSLNSQADIFKKNPNRKFNKKYLDEKENILKYEVLNFNNALKEITVKFRLTDATVESIDKIRSNFSQVKNYLADLISIKRVSAEEEQEESEKSDSEKEEEQEESETENENEEKMADFNFETAMKLPSLSDAKSTAIRDFLDSVEAYHDILKQDHKIILLQYIVKAKISGDSKTKLGQYVPNNFGNFKRKILSACGTKENFETLKQMLDNAKQGNKSLLSLK